MTAGCIIHIVFVEKQIITRRKKYKFYKSEIGKIALNQWNDSKL